MARKNKFQKANGMVLWKASPAESARLFRDTYHPNLICQRQEWKDYDPATGAYVVLDDEDIEAEISRFLIKAQTTKNQPVKVGKGKKQKDAEAPKLVPFNPKNNDVLEVVKALKRLTLRSAQTFEAPCWLTPKTKGRPRARDVIVCKNGLVDITTGKKFSDLTPDFYTFTALPVDHNPDAPAATRWNQYLEEVSNGQADFIESVQMMLGLLLTNDTSYQVIFHLHGVSRGGKGTLNRVIAALCGSVNIANPSIAGIAGTFGLMDLQIKSLAVFADADCHDKKKMMDAAAIFNRISGEDPVRIDRKHKPPIDARLFLHLLYISNRLPDFGEHATAISHRLRVLSFQRSFAGVEDFDLEQKLLAELSGILNFALEGLRKLRAIKRFPETEASKALKTKMLRLSNPTRGFVEEKCVLDPNAAIAKDDLFNDYKWFCQENGVHYTKSKDEFALDLMQLFPCIGDKRAGSDGNRVWMFTGIGRKWQDKGLPLEATLYAARIIHVRSILTRYKDDPDSLYRNAWGAVGDVEGLPSDYSALDGFLTMLPAAIQRWAKGSESINVEALKKRLHQHIRECLFSDDEDF